MMVTPNKNITPLSPKAPNLPIGPVNYAQDYINQLLNVLRLYFNQVDNFSLSLSVPDYGITADRPNATNNRLLIGQTYYDTTLGIPIWWNGTVWKNASGTTV
jgi:hypothetical protein